MTDSIVTIDNSDWYDILVDDCKTIVSETRDEGLRALVKGYHKLGERIATENNLDRTSTYGKKIFAGLGKSLDMSTTNLYRAVQLYEKYPDFEQVPNESWTQITMYYLPDNKRPVSYHVSDDSHEWYTPETYISAARGVMGGIDLDPTTSQQAQEQIKADTYYTKEDDGLSKPWFGRVWLNPPYDIPEKFIDKAVEGYKSGNIEAAIILTNNSTDTGWFHKLIEYPFCLTLGRIKFWYGDDILAARQGQAIFYLGKNPDLFATVFSVFGAVVKQYDNK